MSGGRERDRLYDAYLDELLSGVAPEPEEFLRAAGVEDAALLAKLRGLQAAAQVVPAADPDAGAGDPAGEELPFERIAGYRLLSHLGGGGMGTVYLAEQESLGRKVALKLIRPELVGSKSASERFQREARALATLRDPGVVTVFGYGVERGVHYLAMELVPGLDLTETIERAREEGAAVPPSDAVRWAADVARALQAVHGQGIVHRDVKASNIRIAPDGRAVLVDFGLSREQGAEGPTLTRSFVGSPAYASPEQVRGLAELDPRSDVYSLGVTLYRAVTGRAPFQGKSIEALFRQVLEADPVPPKRLRPAIPRDLEVVILHAMAKDPEARYQTAAALADDLEAVLEFRPIRARPPSSARRLRAWSRHHRASSAALLTGFLALVAGGVLVLLQARQAAADAKERAVGLVAEARGLFHDFVAEREGVNRQAQVVKVIEGEFETNFVPTARIAELDRSRDQARQASMRRERTFNRALDLLDQAERIDPEVPGLGPVRAELYLTRFQEAVADGDLLASRFYRGQAARYDDGAVWERIQSSSQLRLEVEPPGAVRLQAFRYQEHAELVDGGEARMVPVPMQGSPPLDPGSWCLRVVEPGGGLRSTDLVFEFAGSPIRGAVLVADDAGELRRYDRLLSVDGAPVLGEYEVEQLCLPAGPARTWRFLRQGVEFQLQAESAAALGVELLTAEALATRCGGPARVYRGGRLLELELTPALGLRTTGSPLLCLPENEVEVRGRDQVITFEPGSVLLLVRREGYEDCLVQMPLKPGDDRVLPIRLAPAGTSPPGFVRVLPQPVWAIPSYWIMERELTSAEYLEFLNAPETQARMAGGAEPPLYPRSFEDAAAGGSWKRDTEGRFHLPDHWPGAWPAFGVSWNDAVAYAEWRTARARARGLPYTFRLPTLGEFRVAARGSGLWAYPYGPWFRPNWSNCCFSRPKPAPEPVRRYPIDESAFRVYDGSGSALEWLDAWWDPDQSLRFAGGGSWAQGGAVAAKPTSGLGMPPGATSMETSFRLVLEIDGYGAAGEPGGSGSGG